MDSILKKATREVVMALLFWLPDDRRIRIERWLRGREETRRLERADRVRREEPAGRRLVPESSRLRSRRRRRRSRRRAGG